MCIVHRQTSEPQKQILDVMRRLRTMMLTSATRTKPLVGPSHRNHADFISHEWKKQQDWQETIPLSSGTL